jgi:hypothetical protein
MQPKPEVCPERAILESRFHADVRVYRDAIDRLDACPPKDFEVVYEAAERARLAFENARFALNRHIAEHGCG